MLANWRSCFFPFSSLPQKNLTGETLALYQKEPQSIMYLIPFATRNQPNHQKMPVCTIILHINKPGVSAISRFLMWRMPVNGARSSILDVLFLVPPVHSLSPEEQWQAAVQASQLLIQLVYVLPISNGSLQRRQGQSVRGLLGGPFPE